MGNQKDYFKGIIPPPIIFFISFIENEEVVKKILKHLGLWLEPARVYLLVHGLSLAGASTRNRTLKYSRTIGDVLDKLDKG